MTQLQKGAFQGGLALGVALLLIRLSTARAFGDFLLAAALTLAEFSVIWVLEKKARRLEIEIADHLADAKRHGEAERKVQAKKDELARRQALLDDTASEISEIEAQFDQDVELGDLKALIAIGINAIRSGYHAGISANAGELGGVKRNEDESDDHKEKAA